MCTLLEDPQHESLWPQSFRIFLHGPACWRFWHQRVKSLLCHLSTLLLRATHLTILNVFSLRDANNTTQKVGVRTEGGDACKALSTVPDIRVLLSGCYSYTAHTWTAFDYEYPIEGSMYLWRVQSHYEDTLRHYCQGLNPIVLSKALTLKQLPSRCKIQLHHRHSVL